MEAKIKINLSVRLLPEKDLLWDLELTQTLRQWTHTETLR